MCFQFGFVIFWQKDFGAKAAHKMLVKLTPGLQKTTLTRALVTGLLVLTSLDKLLLILQTSFLQNKLPQ
jgi:hypothetical protein